MSLSEEDRARTDCYALISRLYYAPPDATFLSHLGGGNGGVAGLQDAETGVGANSDSYAATFRALQDASREADPHALRQEFDDLFVGAGRALISPYTSGYAGVQAPDRYLLALRERLAALGLGRRDAVFELEDHVSAVCDVMRWLIIHRPLGEQVDFFNAFVCTPVTVFCSAIEKHATSGVYRAAARLARVFIAIEKEAFDLEIPE